MINNIESDEINISQNGWFQDLKTMFKQDQVDDALAREIIG